MYTEMGNSPRRNALNAVTCFMFYISNMMFDYVTVIYDSYLGILGTRSLFHLWVITLGALTFLRNLKGKLLERKKGTNMKNVTI